MYHTYADDGELLEKMNPEQEWKTNVGLGQVATRRRPPEGAQEVGTIDHNVHVPKTTPTE